MEGIELKKQIIAVLREVESSKVFPETIIKKVPVWLIFSKINVSLKEMKKAIKDLVQEEKILFFSDESITRIAKYMNQNPPTRDALLKQPTEDELFGCGFIVNIS